MTRSEFQALNIGDIVIGVNKTYYVIIERSDTCRSWEYKAVTLFGGENDDASLTTVFMLYPQNWTKLEI